MTLNLTPQLWLSSPKIEPEYDMYVPSELAGLRWGIVGAGGIAGLFTRQLIASGGNVYAVASRTLEKAQAFQQKFGSGRYGKAIGQVPGGGASYGGGIIEQAYGSYEELFADDNVDVIYIATPHSDHYQWAIKVLEAGKPLLIEKSITRNYTEAKAIFDLAEQKQLFVMEAVWTRFLPHIREVKKIVDRGDLGEIVALFADFGIRKDYDTSHRLYDPNLAGGALLDLGIYPLTFMQHILGTPTTVTSKMVKAPTGVDANLAMICEFSDSSNSKASSGTQALLHTTSLAQTSTRAVISGTKGRVEINEPFYRPSTFTVYNNDGSTYTYDGKVEQVELFGEDGRFGMNFEAIEVARCLVAGKTQSDIMPWSDTLEMMKLMDNIRYEHNFKYPGE